MSRSRIGALLSVQSIQRNMRARELAEARQKLKEAEAREQETRQGITDARQLKTETKSNDMSADEIGLYEDYIEDSQERLVSETKETEKGKVEEEKRRARLVHTLKELKGYERYEERLKAQDAEEQRTREARELDEIAIQAFYARKR